MTTQEFLDGLYEDRGRIEPEDVVEVASDPRHPMHGRFIWDDSEAAHRYRLVQASQMIRTCKVKREIVDRGKVRTVHVRSFPNVSGEDGETYVPLAVVEKDPDLASVLMADMDRDIRLLKRKYEAHANLLKRVLQKHVA